MTGTHPRVCVHRPCPCCCPPPLGGQPPPAHPRAPWGASPPGSPLYPPWDVASRCRCALAPSWPDPPRWGQRCAASVAPLGSRHGQSAPPSTDRSVQRLIPRCRWTAPASRWAARHCSGPPGEGTRAQTDAAPVPPPPPPRGLTRKAPAPLRFARAISSCHPFSPSRGLC